MRKNMLLLGVSVFISVSMVIPTSAAWRQDGSKKRWVNDDGSLAANGWRWIDDNNDGIKECFYFDSDGYVLIDTRTPDGYMVNSKGEWIVDGEVQREYPEAIEPEPEVKEVTVESLIADNKEFLDRLLNAAATGNHDMVLSEIEKYSYEFRSKFPAGVTSVCYPSENGVGLKFVRKDARLYYGPLVNGKAEGQGKGYYVANAVISRGLSTCYFDGMWSNDAPNGFGIETRKLTDYTINKYPMTLIISGNYTNWYENGNMTRIYTSGKTGESRTFRYEAYNGLGIAVGRNWFSEGEHDVVANSEELGAQSQLTFYETEQTALTREAQLHVDSRNRGFGHNVSYFAANWSY